MPTPNDLSAKPVRVLVNNGTNDLDVSAAFQQFTLSADQFTPEGWWRPTCQLTLASATALAESFDPKANPTRWRPGNVVSVAVDFGGGYIPIPVRLKIQKWPARPRRGQRRIDLQLCGDPTLLSYRSPEGDAGGATYGSDADRATLINAILTEAGHPTIGTDTLTAYPLKYSPEKKTAGPWIDFAGDLAWSANHLLWQQTDGTVRIAELSPTSLAALPCFTHYTVGDTAARYEPQDPTDTPPDTFEGNGTGLTLTPASNDPEEFTNVVDGVTVTTRITYTGQGTSTPTKTVEILKPRNVILPDQSTSTLAAVATETRTEDFYNLDGTLDRTIVTVREPIGVVFPERSFSSPFNLTAATEKTVEYFYDADKAVDRITTDIRKAKYTTTGSNLADYQYIDERWRKRAGREKPEYTRDVTNQDADASATPKLDSPPSNQAPPATQFQPPANSKDQADYEATISVASGTGGGYFGKPQVIQLPGGLATSDAQVEQVIRLWAAIRHGRQWPIAWAAPLTAAWLQNFTPIKRIDFTEGSTRTAYLVDALQIALTRRTARVGGNTIELGTTNADGTDPPTPSFTITSP